MSFEVPLQAGAINMITTAMAPRDRRRRAPMAATEVATGVAHQRLTTQRHRRWRACTFGDRWARRGHSRGKSSSAPQPDCHAVSSHEHAAESERARRAGIEVNEQSADERVAALRAARSERRRRFPARGSRVGVTVAATVGFMVLIPVMGPLRSSAAMPDDSPTPQPTSQPTSTSTSTDSTVPTDDEAPTDTVDTTIALTDVGAPETVSAVPTATTVPLPTAPAATPLPVVPAPKPATVAPQRTPVPAPAAPPVATPASPAPAPAPAPTPTPPPAPAPSDTNPAAHTPRTPVTGRSTPAARAA